MKRLWTVLTLLALVAVGVVAARKVGERFAVLNERVRVAQAYADSLAGKAALDSVESAKVRAERDAFRVATDDATRRVTATTARASGAVREALDALSDTLVTLDSLRGLVRGLAAAWRADSVAQAEREAAWLARAMQYERVIASDSVALRSAWDALAAEQRAHAATRAIPRKGLIARVTPYVAVAGVAYLAGALDVP